jgi:hypothetical protein
MTGGLNPLQSYPGTTSAEGLVCDANQVYISGYYNNTANYYHAVTPAAPTFGASQAEITNGANNGMYIAAYNKSGLFQWVNSGNLSNDMTISMGIRLTVDASGVYAIAPFSDSITYNTTPRGSTFNMTNTVGISSYNIGIVKYTLAGSVVWVNKILNVDSGSPAARVDVNGFGLSSDGSALYLTGGFGQNTIGLYQSSTAGDPTPQVATLSTAGDTNTNAFLIKYNLLGTLQWSTIIGRSGSTAYGYGVYANTNNVYVTGAASGPVNLYHANGLSQPNKIATSLITSANLYTYVIKYDYAGQVIFG